MYSSNIFIVKRDKKYETERELSSTVAYLFSILRRVKLIYKLYLSSEFAKVARFASYRTIIYLRYFF